MTIEELDSLPVVGEDVSPVSVREQNGNAISSEELDALPIIGEDVSPVSGREQNGNAISSEELDALPIVGETEQQTPSPAVPTQQPPPKQPQKPDTYWQERDAEAKKFNLGDAVGSAARTVGKAIGKGLDAIESGKMRLEGKLFPADSLQSEMAASGGATAGKMMKTAANVPLNAVEAAGNLFGQDEVREFAARAKEFIDQKIDTTMDPLVTGNPEWDKKLDTFREMGTSAVATLLAYSVPGAASVDIAATSINTFFNRLREGLDKGMTFNDASTLALIDAGLEGAKGVTIRRFLKGAKGPGAFFDKLVEEGLTALKFAGIDVAQDLVQQKFEDGKKPDWNNWDFVRAKEKGQEGLVNAVVFQTVAGASRKAAGVVFDRNTDPKGGIQDLEKERERARQQGVAEEVASRFTPEQETALNERIPEFIGADTDLQIRVRDRIAAKMKREAAGGSTEGKDPLRTRLDDPAEMEKEIETAVEELLFEDNAQEIAKGVNTDTLGVKAGDRIVDFVQVMPRTADKAESRIAGEVAAASPEMPPERVWEVAEWMAAHEGETNPGGQPLTKERVAEIERQMSMDAAGTVPVEQPDGTLKTINEVEAEAAREERKNLPPEEAKPAPDATAPEATAPATKPVEPIGKWTPVAGKSGVWHTPEFPDVEIALRDAPVAEAEPGKAPGKIMFIENLPEPSALDEDGQMKLGKFIYEQVDIATKAGIKEINVGKTPEDAAKYAELVDRYEAKVNGDKFQARADGVLGVLKKSGLATEVIATEAEFNAKLEQEGYALRATDGRTYGFTDGKNVYLNPAFFRTREGLNTPIHEFGHLGIEATKKINRPLYDRGVELIKQTGLFKDVSEHPDYAGLSEEARATEALTRLIAERGENLEANTPKGVIAEIKKWLVEFWKDVGRALGIRDLNPAQVARMTVEDVADAIRAEMMSGREFGTRELSLAEGDLKAKILRFGKYSKPTSKNAKAALEAAKKAWKGLTEEQKVALGRYGDTSVLKTPEARTIANGIRMLREWDARREKISAQVRKQVRKHLNEAQKRFITSSPRYYISEVTGDTASPFAFAVEKGLPIPRPGDWGWDAWKNLTDGMKYRERRELEKIIGGKHPKRGGMDAVLSDYAQFIGVSWDEGARDYEYGNGIEDFLADILKERERFEEWRSGDRKTRAEEEAEAAEAAAAERERNYGFTDEEFAEEDAWVQAAMERRRVEAERMGEQDDYDEAIPFSRAPFKFTRGPSALGDGKQKYCEVPFEKAVDKIVKNKKALSDEDVFVSQTPKPFQEIGLAKLPILMNQRHVLSCYFGPGEGVNQHHLHGLHNALKMLPRALEHPLMIIASESRPSDSVVAIVKLRDRDGNQMLAPIEINGIGREGDSRIDAHIASSFFGKKNAWTEMIANALRNEVEGKVSVFYLDSNKAKTIQNRLASDAFNIGRSELQSLSRSNASSTWHSITDADSPVNGVIADQTQTRQFKEWFGDSKVVDRAGKPRVVYHGTPNGEFTKFDKEMIGSTWDADEIGFFFTSAKSLAEDYTKPYFKEESANPHLFQVYLSIQNPLVIDQKWWRESFGRSDIYKHDAIEIWDTEQQTIIDALKKGNYDGVIIKPNPLAGDPEMYVAFNSEQIKSATDNIGTFDPLNPDIRFSRGSRAVFVGGRTRVADDAEHGERSPGGLAAARELADVRNSPVSALGARRFLSLSISDMEELRKIVTGDIVPSAVAKNLPSGGVTKKGGVVIHADVIGTVDRTDVAAEKENLKRHGFFRNEDPNWAMSQPDAAVAAEAQRSERTLSRQLEALGERRLRGEEPGGQTAERGVFADWMVSCLLGPYGALYGLGITTTEVINMWIKGRQFGTQGQLPSLFWTSNFIVHDPARLIRACFSDEKTFDDVLDAAAKWASDSNVTIRDFREIYRWRIKEKPQ